MIKFFLLARERNWCLLTCNVCRGIAKASSDLKCIVSICITISCRASLGSKYLLGDENLRAHASSISKEP